MTFYEVPRGALAPELTKDYDQRNKISGVGMALGWIGGAGISFIHMQYFLGDSYFNASGYQLFIFAFGLITFFEIRSQYILNLDNPWPYAPTSSALIKASAEIEA